MIENQPEHMSPRGLELSDQARDVIKTQRRISISNAVLFICVAAFIIFGVYILAALNEGRAASQERDVAIEAIQAELKTICRQAKPGTLPADGQRRCDRAEQNKLPPVVEEIQGEQGARGLMGFPGIDGADCDPDIDPNCRGPKGDKGDAGDPCDPADNPACRGPQGGEGDKGDQGDPCDPVVTPECQGPKGDKGDQGDPCDPNANPECRGPKGDEGDPGGQGPRGFFIVEAVIEEREEQCLLIFTLNDEAGTQHSVELPKQFCVPS